MKLQFFSDYSIIILSMKKVKHILAIFLHSFVPQDIYYPKLLHTRFQFSLKYYFVIMAFFAFVFAGVILCRYSPSRLISYKNSVINSLSTFPDNITIKIHNGMLESNQNVPLFLWVYHDGQPLFVFMVHTKDVVTSSSIPSPLLFLGNDKVQISYRGTSIVQTYNKLWDITITKQSVQSLISAVNAFFPFFMILFYVSLIILLPLLYALSFTFFILVSALIVFMLLRTFVPHIHLKKCIQGGIHGTHIPFLLTIFLFILFPTATNIFIVAASLVFVFTLVSTYEMYSKEVVQLSGR